MASTEVKPIDQDQISEILAGNVESILIPKETKEEKPEVKPEEKTEEKPEVKSQKFVKDSLEIDWDKIDEMIEEKPEEKPEEEEEKSEDKPEKKPGRKPVELVDLVNKMIKEGELIGFEDDGEVTTIEEAKKLIKGNIQEAKSSSFEDLWKSKIESYSPQVQAILHYAEQGGEDITPLLTAISQIEHTENLDLNTEEGQKGILKEYYKSQGWKDEDIDEEIALFVDTEKLKPKAEKILPMLEKMRQKRIEAMMVEQEARNEEVQKAREVYYETVKNALSKDKLGDVKLDRSQKGQIWRGLTDNTYKSWNGTPTNGFYKTLEELQVGDNQNYDHFLEIVFLALDRDGFKEKLRDEIKSEQAANTARKLKTEQKRQSSEASIPGEEKKKGIKREAFKNPFSS